MLQLSLQTMSMAYRLPRRIIQGSTHPELVWEMLRLEIGPVVNGDVLDWFCYKYILQRGFVNDCLGLLAEFGAMHHPRRNLWTLWRPDAPLEREAVRAIEAAMSLGKWCVPNGNWALVLAGIVPVDVLQMAEGIRYCTTYHPHRLTTHQTGFEPSARHMSWFDGVAVTTTVRRQHQLPHVVPLTMDLDADPSMQRSSISRSAPAFVHIAHWADAIFDLFDRVRLNGGIDTAAATLALALQAIDLDELLSAMQFAPLAVRRRFAWALTRCGFELHDIRAHINLEHRRSHATSLDPRRKSAGPRCKYLHILDNRTEPFRNNLNVFQ